MSWWPRSTTSAGESVAGACRDEFGADVRFVHTDASAKDDVTAMVATAVDRSGARSTSW